MVTSVVAGVNCSDRLHRIHIPCVSVEEFAMFVTWPSVVAASHGDVSSQLLSRAAQRRRPVSQVALVTASRQVGKSQPNRRDHGAMSTASYLGAPREL